MKCKICGEKYDLRDSIEAEWHRYCCLKGSEEK
jgi:hypothetical protein